MRTLAILLGLVLLSGGLRAASPSRAPGKPPAPSVDLAKSPAVEMARSVSLVTGVALSPLLGAGAVGAYDFLSTPKERRKELHWYASPLFWIPALLVVGVIALKDALGAATPPGLKKPFDVAEVVENKISGVVAAAAFLPATLGIFSLFSGSETATADLSLSAAGLATVDARGILQLLLTPFAFVAFVLVWMTSHALTVLILLSPFPVVDASLKAFRAFLLSLVTVTSFVNPWVGLIFASGLILVSYFLAGWSFRLTVFGWVFAWDFFTRRRRRFLPTTNANWMFLARAEAEVPVRTYGRLVKGGDGLFTFEYRPWLVLPPRTWTLPPGRYSVGKGLFFSEIHRLRPGEEESQDLFDLPPRYRSHEDDLGHAYGFVVEDVGLLRGLKGAWRWVKGIVKRNEPMIVEPSAAPGSG